MSSVEDRVTDARHEYLHHLDNRTHKPSFAAAAALVRTPSLAATAAAAAARFGGGGGGKRDGQQSNDGFAAVAKIFSAIAAGAIEEARESRDDHVPYEDVFSSQTRVTGPCGGGHAGVQIS